MSEINKCPKCGGEMEEGQMFTQPPLVWGKEVGLLGVKDGHKIIAKRCKICGYLESFAK
jgi:predicted nucleic-acid-binding Zn-ribbon protein